MRNRRKIVIRNLARARRRRAVHVRGIKTTEGLYLRTTTGEVIYKSGT